MDQSRIEPEETAIPSGPTHSDASSEVERLLCAWLAAVERGEEVDFVALCAARPELAADLRAARAVHEEGEALLAGLAAEPGAAELLEPLEPARYEVLGELARGGMGVVLEVEDRLLHRTLAMKRPGTRPGDAGSFERLRAAHQHARLVREAQVLAQLEHPGIVPLHDLGTDQEGRPCLVMLRVRGRELGEVFCLAREEREGWTTARALGVLLRVCDAVAYAHSNGVLHRDLKPSNVMVGRFGETYVMDWGLARVRGAVGVEGESPNDGSDVRTDPPSSPLLASLAGDVVGTPAYMPPEQARGSAEEIDERADVYAIGALLYHLLAGGSPYSREEAGGMPLELLKTVRTRAPEPLHRAAPHAPHELVAVCEKAMSRKPARRYASVAELAEDLRSYRDGHVVRAYRTGAWVELTKWVRRNREATTAILAVALGLATTVGVLFHSNREIRARSEELAGQLYLNRIDQIQNAWEREEVGRMQDLLAACPERFRDWEWHAFRRLSDRSVASVEGTTAAVSPDGRWIVTRVESNVVIWDARSLEEVGTIPVWEIPRIVFLDSESFYLCETDNSTYRWSLRRVPDGEKIQDIETLSDAQVRKVCLAPSSRLLAVATAQGELGIVDTSTHEFLRSVPAHGGSLQPQTGSRGFDMEWRPEGTQIATAGGDGWLKVWDAVSLESVQEQRRNHPFYSVAWSSDGRRIATGSLDGSVQVWELDPLQPPKDLAGGHGNAPVLASSPGSQSLVEVGKAVVRAWSGPEWSTVELLGGHTSAVNVAEFSEGGSDLVTSAGQSRQRATRIWNLEPLAWRELGNRGNKYVRRARFSPDGRSFAVSVDGRGVEIWDVAARSSRRELFISEGYLICAFAPGAEQVATVGGSGALRVWDVESGKLEQEIGAHGGRINDVIYHPNRKRVSTAGNDGSLKLWDVTTGTLLWDVHGPVEERWPQGILAPTFSPDGRWIAAGANDGPVRIWHAETGELFRELRGPSKRYSGWIRFDPTGERIVALGTDSVTCWSVDAGQLLWSALSSTRAARTPTDTGFTPDGNRLLIANGDGSVEVWDGRSGEPIATLRWIQGLVGCMPSLSPDGRRLALVADNARVRFHDLQPLTEGDEGR